MKSWDRLCLVAARSEGLLIDFILIFFVRWGLHALGVGYVNYQPVLDSAAPPYDIADILDYPVSAVFYGAIFFSSGLPELYTWGIWLLYTTLGLAIFGRTIGMRQAEIRLMSADGRRAGAIRVLIRQLLVPVSSICWVGYWLLGFTPGASALHDLVSGTRVVYESGVSTK